jgi:hypothetical protein
MYWLNVDMPNRTCTFHWRDCTWKPRQEPKYKGFGKLKRDGGWLSFSTEVEAQSYYRGKWQEDVQVQFCKPS